MARIRTIKPSFFKNEQLADLPMQVRLLFIGLWTLADKEGKLEDRPKRIKVELFPYDTLNIDELLERLQSAGFITRYEVGEMKVIKIVNFTKHQRITGTEVNSDSEFPEPSEGNILDIQGNTLETPRTTGREGKGRERKGKDAREAPDDCKKYDFLTEIFKPDFISEWEKWKDYKLKEFKFQYNSIASEKASFTELVTLSNKNQALAAAIMQQSIANGWKGFFEIKNQHKNTEPVRANNHAPPRKIFSKTEKDINFLYEMFLEGSVKIGTYSSEYFDYLQSKGVKLNEKQQQSVEDAAHEHMEAQQLSNKPETIAGLKKVFSIIEHFKFLKKKGYATVFRME